MSYNKKRVKQLEAIVDKEDSEFDSEHYFPTISNLAFPIRFVFQFLVIAGSAYLLILFGGAQ